ncbi:hypothetical protein JCM8547_001985 [Rhodosporidiobolus lusitaniae]
MSRSSFPPTQPRTPLSILLHLFAFASLSWSFRYLYTPGPLTDFMAQSFGGRWQFLTILSLAASWLTFAFSLLYDLLPLPLFARLKTSFAVLAVPVEGFVAAGYWGLTLYDPSLLNPPSAEFRLPLGVDMSIHGLPALYLWLDFLLFSPRFPSRVRPLSLALIVTLAYSLWMELCASKNGAFPYPMFDALELKYRLGVYVVSVPLVVGLYGAANGVHGLVRGSSSGEKEARLARKVEKEL